MRGEPVSSTILNDGNVLDVYNFRESNRRDYIEREFSSSIIYNPSDEVVDMRLERRFDNKTNVLVDFQNRSYRYMK